MLGEGRLAPPPAAGHRLIQRFVARQLASRARRRIQGSAAPTGTDPNRQREVVTAFLAASRGGDFDALLALLDPDVVLRADRVAVQVGASRETRGAAAVADTFFGRATAAQPALVYGAAGVVWASISFTIAHGRITAIELVADPERLRHLDLAILDR